MRGLLQLSVSTASETFLSRGYRAGEHLLLLYSINVLVHLAIAFTYIVTSHGVLGTRQALEPRRFLCEQPLSRGVSCLPLLHARVKENVPVQNDANVVTYVEGLLANVRCTYDKANI